MTSLAMVRATGLLQSWWTNWDIAAIVLSWLYPRAKFLVLTRNPLDAYKSIAHSTESYRLWASWPDGPVESAVAFADHWNRIVLSWEQKQSTLKSRHVRYEDIINRSVDFRSIESWLGLRLAEEEALDLKIGGTARADPVTWYERHIVTRTARAGMKALGYRA